VAVEQFDPRLVDRESGGFADDLALAGLGVEPPDSNRVGKPVEVGACDVGLGRQDDFVEQRQRDVGPELVAQVARTPQVGFVLDGHQRVDPVGVACRRANGGVTVATLALEVAHLDGTVGGRAGALGVTVEGVGRPDRAPGTHVALDRQRRDGLGGDSPAGVELRTRFDGDDVDDPAAVNGAAELAGVEPVGSLALQAGTQREFERELLHRPSGGRVSKSSPPPSPPTDAFFGVEPPTHFCWPTSQYLGDTWDTMDSNTPVTGQDFDRGQSGMIGFVIVVGMVIAGAVIVVFAGSTALTDLQQERSDAQARIVMEEVDSQLTTLANSDQSATGYFSLGDLDGQESRVVRRGYLNVTVNERTGCRTNVTLSSVRYENDEGETVAYQAGGVFVANDNGSAVQTPPNVQFRNGSLDVTVTNITGEVSNTRNEAFYNATSSTRESRERSAKVVSGECIRPDNVTISVRSDFYRAWETYFRGEFDADDSNVEVGSYTSNQTAYAYVPQDELPRRTDDERNNVINMSDSPMASFMDDVEINDNTVTVTKGTSNTYAVYVEPLTQNRLDIGDIREVEGATNVTGPPRDVVFVIDESGSMSFNMPGAVDRTAAAQEAIKNFVGTLNESKDRAGLVGYSSDNEYACASGNGGPRPDFAPYKSPAWIYATGGKYLTFEYDAFNSTVDETTSRCGTWGSAGLSKGNQLLHLKSNQTREQVIIFLSDGNFRGPGTNEQADDLALERASVSKTQDVTIYTVGFGSETAVDDEVLEDMAQRTGGEYKFAENQEELNDIFLNISRNIATTRQIALTPTSTNVTTGGGGVFAPQIAGDTDDLATTTRAGQEFVNINDPTAPTHFTHAFPVTDGDSVTFNASTFNCAEWRLTGRTRTNGTTGETYNVARCTEMTTTDETLEPDNIEIFTDGDDLEPLLSGGDDPAWWQDSLNESIEQHPTVRNDSDLNLVTKSNQALVVLDYPDGVNSTNKLALVYQIGRSESDAKADDVVNVRVRNVKAKP